MIAPHQSGKDMFFLCKIDSPNAHSPVWIFPNGKPCPFFTFFNESE